ncbi:MAG: hypothetical protein F8N36_15960 [Desulfovibrio sp.]|uniref:hypothetical protein n=1 Tax=Desulfovibrio sp. TaxID=885 RepID=UPI00135D54E7|nr:hypothetical protein [Desulfovibrio sp.]MTJ94334.1 hypothetical protein [Desulfovibrio sp.]
MNVTGPGAPAVGSAVTFTVSNTTGGTSQPVNFSLSNTTNFQISGGTCVNNTTTLSANKSCTILVQPLASVPGSYSGTLNVVANNNPSVALSGTGSNFAPNLVIAATSGSATAMNVVGSSPGGTLTSGSDTTFTVTNTGGSTSAVLNFALSNIQNFAYDGGTCANGSTTLAMGASCTILVKPSASVDGNYSGKLTVTANNNPSISLVGTASMLAPVQLSVTASLGSSTAMNVTGPGSPASGSDVTFTITNSPLSDYSSAPLVLSVSNPTNFAIDAGGTCASGTTSLAPGGSCTVLVKPQASTNGSYSGNLVVTANNNPTAAMAGTGSGFAPNLVLAVTSGSASAMNVVGPGSPASGTDITVTVTNSGGTTSAALAYALSNTTNFSLDTGGTCVNGNTTLAINASCTIRIKPLATADGPISGNLNVTVNNTPTLALSGTASMFNPAALTLAATSGSPTAMNVVGTSPSVSTTGSPVTFTLTNTGDQTSAALAMAMANGTNFTITGGTCAAGQTVAGGANCTIIVAPKASADGSISDTLKVTANNNPTAAVSGTASMLNPATLTIAATNGNPSAMNVTGPGNPAYGSDVTFTITNTGDYTSAAIGLTLSNMTNFAFNSGGTCVSGSSSLSKAASCTTIVTPKASRGGSYSAVLAAVATNTASLTLSGSASAFCTASASTTTGACSATCGGGTQTVSVFDSCGNIQSQSVQSCNTQGCYTWKDQGSGTTFTSDVTYNTPGAACTTHNQVSWSCNYVSPSNYYCELYKCE